MPGKILIIILSLAPLAVFSQGKNKISFGSGLISERYSDQNFSSLVYTGTGYDMALFYQRQLNKKVHAKGEFTFQSSEIAHRLGKQPIKSSSSGMDMTLLYQLFCMRQHKINMGVGYSRVFETRKSEYGYYSQIQHWMQGLALSPGYVYEHPVFILDFSLVFPVFSRVYSQTYAANGAHNFFYASLHNYSSFCTRSSIFFRIAPSQYVGMNYSWRFNKNEVAKTILSASHGIKVSYSFHF